MPLSLPARRRKSFALSPIKEIELAAVRVPGAVSLAQGIPDFDTPEVIKAYVKERLDAGETARYSLAPGLPELRELVAESLRAEGMHYDPDGEILITAGAIEGIAATLIALTTPGQEVILPSPGYASYQQVVRLAGCEPRFVPLDEERNFDLDVAAIARRIGPRTAAILCCNPNNPTGTICSREQTLAMLELAERHDLLVISDEVYKDFCYTDGPYFSPAHAAARGRVVRIFSFSKAYAMTGWRVGYLHADRPLVARILAAHDSLITCAPVIAQHAAMAALQFGEAAVAEFRAAFRARRDRVLAGLDRLSHVLDYQKPDGAYFVFPRVKDTVPLAEDSRALALDLLHEAGVALVPGVAFGPTGESHLRLSFGRSEADLDAGLERLNAYFARRMGAARFAAGPPATTEAAARPAQPTVQRRRRGVGRALALGWLRGMARLYLWRRRPGVIAIAGNQGKTVAKRVLARALEGRFALRANPRSYNTEVGLPLAVLGLELDPRSWPAVGRTLWRATWRACVARERLDWLILELGARVPGDMAALLGVVRPDWAVVTNLVPEGADPPEDAATLRDEIATLCRTMPPERLLLSGDDPLLADLPDGAPGVPIRLALAHLEPAGAGHRYRGERDAYDLGPELAGASVRYAVQAAIRLGERLGCRPDELRAFLQAETGAPLPEPVAPSGTPAPVADGRPRRWPA